MSRAHAYGLASSWTDGQYICLEERICLSISLVVSDNKRAAVRPKLYRAPFQLNGSLNCRFPVCPPFRPDTFSHQHASAMHWATWGGHTEIVKLLLEHRVSLAL